MAAFLAHLILPLAIAQTFAPGTPNMNGEYLMQRTPSQGAGNWSSNFSDYPGGVEFFEVYAGPVTSTYSEVFWTALPNVPLPPALVKRFEGGAIAVVGFELDQVRRLDMNDSTKDVSLPINVAYNHHYGIQLLGAGSRMGLEAIPEYDPTDTSRIVHHPSPIPGYREVPIEHTPDANGLPTSMVFGYSNGGEFRKTYHGLAPPFAQLVASPQEIKMTPMQIDTWNRDKMNLTGGKFVAGPAPRNSFAPTTGVDAIYSGLLECPLTTRIRKHVTSPGGSAFNTSSLEAQIYTCAKAINTGNSPPQVTCATPVKSSAACFAAKKDVAGLAGLTVKSVTASTPAEQSAAPPGCSVATDLANGTATLTWNPDAKSAACCGVGVASTHGISSTTSDAGKIGVTLDLELTSVVATITMKGPATAWFGVGFDVDSMANSPYAVIVDGVKGTVTERVLGQELPGAQINASVTVVSTSVTNGVRTVVMTRPLKGASALHHTFVKTKLTLPFIAAVGSSEVFGYHRAKTSDILTLWPSDLNAACVCRVSSPPFGQGVGSIEYMPTGENIGFNFRCNPTESVFQNKNPTCDIRTYAGGLSTCHHGWHLLDQDQDVPWMDQPLKYWFKIRMYYQPYVPATATTTTTSIATTTTTTAASHIQVEDITWSIGGATGEYDVPRCAPGTATVDCTHAVTGTVTPPGDDLHFVAAHYHCHAPTCLSLEIRYGNETGELICKESPYHGVGNDLALRGATDRFDEAGYIGQRVCLWGSPPLEPPPLVSGKLLWIRAITNSTYGHHGEMALPQMLLSHLPPGGLAAV